MPSHENKKAVVTGAAGGIGFEVAKLLGSSGATVAILDVNPQATERAVADLESRDIQAIGRQLDVTDEAAVQEIFAALGDELGGRLDVLINNAGIADFGSVDNSSLASWERVMAVNVTGTFLCSRAAIPLMKTHGGAIVNFSSVAGRVGIPGMAAYCTAKAAIIGLTRQMAAEYSGQNIRVNCVCPGTVATTAMGKQLLGSDTSPETQARRLAKYPIGRFGEPEEIARVVAFLASDDASFVSGADYAVDGAMTAI